VHQRDTHDDVAILGGNIQLQAEHLESVQETKDLGISDTYRTNLRNRLGHIIEWWKANYPGYYDVGVKVLSEQEQMDPTKYYYKGKYKYDLVYAGLNVHMLTAFLSWKKQKENGKLSSKVQLRKYKDAILWGSRVADEPLPSSFYTEIDTFLSSFKKEHIRAKKMGILMSKKQTQYPGTCIT
jgi:hypothetical protein